MLCVLLCVKSGKGLGKNEAGMAKPVKCSLKFNKSGIGYDKKVSEEETNRWWIKRYNNAASTIFSNKTDESLKKDSRKQEDAFNELTDEELFAACGGRTAHKAARHGLKLCGKLERIRNQEKLVESGSSTSEELNKTNAISISTVKIRKKRMIDELTTSELCNDECIIQTPNVVPKKKKKNGTDEVRAESKSMNEEIFGSNSPRIRKKKEKKI